MVIIDSQVAAFMVVAAILTITPGADTMLVIRNVLIGTRQHGVATTFGICSGLFIHALFSAMGVSLILLHSATLFRAVKIIGACYLVWLGWRSIWNAIQHRGTIALNENTPPRSCSLHKCFAEGFLTNVLNPKVAIFYLAFLPQFISPGDPVFSKSILLTGIHYTMGIAWLVSISFLLDYARGVITKTSIRHWLNGLCGMILVGIGFKLIAEKN